MESYYPPGPNDVPEGLAIPTFAFKVHAFLVLFALAIFFVFYFGMIIYCATYCLGAFWFLLFSDTFGEWLGIRLIPMLFVPPCGILFVLLVKNLLKFERVKKDSLIEIFHDEHPRLFDFIDKVCADVGSDRPKHVYVDYDVNAGAMLDTTSHLHLFLPTRRSLVLGLGLVNALNLTEFKALLAHEFGHCAQRAMKITAYVYAVRRIVHHALRGEDFVDRFIIAWSQWHPLIAWPAYFLRGMQWLLRKVLFQLFYVICFFDFALSRQMELNADLIAVRVTGSDAPVHLLFRASFADACFTQAATDLDVARIHHFFTSDIFHHQREAARILRKLKKAPRLGEPPLLPVELDQTTQVFDEANDPCAGMGRPHPSCRERERNAKAIYIRTTFDERSPWILFDNVEALRERASLKFYRTHLKMPKSLHLTDPLQVQAFIDAEHADRAYDPKYQSLYDDRRLELEVADIQEIAQACARRPAGNLELVNAHETLFDGEVGRRAQIHSQRWEEFHLLTAVSNGWHRPRNEELEFRGKLYDPEEAGRLLEMVEKELDEDRAWLATLDHKVFATYFQMALHIGQEIAEELFGRYRFQLELQAIGRELERNERPVSAALAFLQAQPSMGIASHPLRKTLELLRAAHAAMMGILERADKLELPALRNLPPGQILKSFLLEEPLLENVGENDQSIPQDWLNRFSNQFRAMKNKVDRLHFKSLAGILMLQERIGDECARRCSHTLAKVQSCG